MRWIECEYQREDIPECLFYDGYQIDKDDEDKTALMLWIQYHKNMNMPEKLFYKNWWIDKDGYDRTPLMLWI